MNKILSTLVIAAILSSTSAFAEDKFRVSRDNGKQRGAFSVNISDRCIMTDDKFACEPML